HNPFQDNGIKFFSSAGFKLPDDVELEIERLVLDTEIDHLRPTAEEIGKAFRIDDALGRYNVFVKNTFPRELTLDGLRVVVDGATLRASAARELAEQGRLGKRTLVTTHMSNFGLELAMRELEIQVVKTQVGDRYVLEEMQRSGYNLGGEQSGHILFLEHTTTG